ncbi:MAG: L,D-transpeptidase family protein [Candidatus Omnitrophica bacterium]|nr:L,D-transpeptidase family protein [Candidatus Omnitrophota bacterium]
MNKRRAILFIILFVLVSLTAIIIFKKVGRRVLIKPGGKVSASRMLAHARQLESGGNLIEAKNIYQKMIEEYPNASSVMNWQRKIDELNIRILFSPTITPGSILYEIKPGDTLAKIAKEFKTTVELIMKSNGITSEKINPGRKIKVLTAPFSIVVYKSQNILLLKTNEEVLKTYIVSTGKNNSTPVGTFNIINKLPNPTWFKAGTVVPPNSPQNILGSRWMGFNLSGYGIHGTTEPQSLGKQVTLGCVRMSNADVEELYTIVPIGTEVTVLD